MNLLRISWEMSEEIPVRVSGGFPWEIPEVIPVEISGEVPGGCTVFREASLEEYLDDFLLKSENCLKLLPK